MNARGSRLAEQGGYRTIAPGVSDLGYGLPRGPQIAVCWKRPLSAPTAATIGQAETATRIAKNSNSMANSQFFSPAEYLRASSRNDRRGVDLFCGDRLVTVLLTLITFIVERSISRRMRGVRLRIVKIA
jgi:hypothetical protein